ncbi:hypothetical protein BTVI_03992 [Pitangus sulphuratus]|nr:hypothetical protein BTVI_03992 [Pitangus sulphuratus]
MDKKRMTEMNEEKGNPNSKPSLGLQRRPSGCPMGHKNTAGSMQKPGLTSHQLDQHWNKDCWVDIGFQTDISSAGSTVEPRLMMSFFLSFSPCPVLLE